MRTIIFLLLLYGSTVSAEFFIEPKVQINGANRLLSFTGTERSAYIGAYADWENDSFYMRFDGEYRYDNIYNSRYSSSSKNEYRNVFWLDEFYFEKKINFFDFYLGFQKVIWGQADELRIVDVINPLDFRQFVLLDLNDYMFPLPMFRVLYSGLEGWDIEAMWIFKFRENKYPPMGSEFYLNTPDNITKRKPDDGEFAISALTSLSGIDVGLYAFRGYTDDPIYNADLHEGYLYFPRDSMLGASFSTAIQSWVVRAETAFFPKKYYNTVQYQQERHNTLKYLFGLDYLYKDWMITAQVSDHYIQGWHKNISELSSSPFYTFSVEGKILADSLSLRFSNTYSNSIGGGNLLQSKIKYQHNPNISFNIYFDVLNGSSANTLGSHSDSSRVRYSVIYRF